MRAENRIHGSDQQSCPPGAPPVMITDHVPAVAWESRSKFRADRHWYSEPVFTTCWVACSLHRTTTGSRPVGFSLLVQLDDALFVKMLQGQSNLADGAFVSARPHDLVLLGCVADLMKPQVRHDAMGFEAVHTMGPRPNRHNGERPVLAGRRAALA